MIKFAPFPHEFITAHLSRLSAVNGFSNTASLLRQQGHNTLQYFHRILATTCGMSAEEYLHEHTLTPLMSLRPATVSQSKMAHRHVHDSATSTRSILTRMPCKFCLLCRDEDTERFGSPYCHREQQAAGMCLCPYHVSALQLCAPDAMDVHPTPREVDCNDVPERLLEACMSPVLKRYHDLCARLLGPR